MHFSQVIAVSWLIAQAQCLAVRATSPTFVKGKTFDRFVTIWLENTDYDLAASETNLRALQKQAILLNNYHAITHPSQPNYVAAVGGSTHGVTSDSKVTIAATERTIVDLLEAKGVSWAEYQEDMPSPGYLSDYPNPVNGKNDYVRKHNPLASYASVSSSADRLAKIKTLATFQSDLKSNVLPQWIFITPNMISVAGAWAKNFLTPLLADKNFLNRTLVLLTFDETANYLSNNTVFSLLLGDAVPTTLYGSTNATALTHYSIMKTVEQNWGLGDLGLGDKTANAFF